MAVEHGDRAGQRVGEQPHVGVHEASTPSAVELGGGDPGGAGVRLAEPAGRGRVGRDQPDPGVGRPPHHGRRPVGRAVVDDDHAQVGDPALVEQRGQAVADLRLLVADRQHHGDRPAHRRRIGRWTAEQRHVQRRRARRRRPTGRRGRARADRSPARPCWTRSATSTGRRARAPGRRAGQPEPARVRERAAERHPGERQQRRRVADPRGIGDRRPGHQQVEQRHEDHAGQQPAGRGWSAAPWGCRATRAPDASRSSSRPAPSAGPGPRPIPAKTPPPPRPDDRAATAAPVAPAARRAPSSARPSSARRAGRGTARRAASGRARRCTVAAVRDPGGQPDRLDGHRGGRDQEERRRRPPGRRGSDPRAGPTAPTPGRRSSS